jgi:glycosyltransferase involved in cell wall biosynthesis
VQHYGAPKGLVSAIGVNGSHRLLRRQVSAFHGVSSYVQEVTQRDFLGAGGALLPRAVIPSFREDETDQGQVEDASIQSYLAQLPSEPFILFVGALRVVKGIKPLLAAYERQANPLPLVLIGTIESDTPREFPPGAMVLQNFPHRAVLAAWERALFGVVPSLWPEPLGSVVHEGMSRGKAVIGTTPGGHTDMLVDGESGLLVPSGDVDALAAAMRRLLDDAALRERLGRAALERARLFTAGNAVPEFEHLYRQILAEARPRRDGATVLAETGQRRQDVEAMQEQGRNRSKASLTLGQAGGPNGRTARNTGGAS